MGPILFGVCNAHHCHWIGPVIASFGSKYRRAFHELRWRVPLTKPLPKSVLWLRRGSEHLFHLLSRRLRGPHRRRPRRPQRPQELCGFWHNLCGLPLDQVRRLCHSLRDPVHAGPRFVPVRGRRILRGPRAPALDRHEIRDRQALEARGCILSELVREPLNAAWLRCDWPCEQVAKKAARMQNCPTPFRD